MQGLGVLAMLGMAHNAAAQDSAVAYTQMAPLTQYLMADRQAEVALARSAAPESISRDAEVEILTPHGYQTAVHGTNGFVCIVGRGWSSAPDADFWNPAVRVPMCVNAAAAHTYLRLVSRITDLALAGRTPAEVSQAITAAVAQQELSPMEPGAMCYMMSKEGNGGDVIPHWPPHVMFFFTNGTTAMWGANLKGSPILGVTDPTEQLTQFVIPVGHWSDGTEYAASMPHMHP